MTEQRTRLQTAFMGAVEAQRTPVSVFLANGVRLQGFLVGEDAYCMLLVHQGRAQLVYKHAISAVLPERPVDLQQGAPPAPPGPAGREAAISAAPAPRPSTRR
jgi:host factor-I protein